MYSYSLGCHSHKCFLDGKTGPDRNFGVGHFRQSSIRRADSLEGIPRIDPGLAYSCNGTPGAVGSLSFQQSFHDRGREPRLTHAHVPRSCHRTGACIFSTCAILDVMERYMHGTFCIQAAFNVERPPVCSTACDQPCGFGNSYAWQNLQRKLCCTLSVAFGKI